MESNFEITFAPGRKTNGGHSIMLSLLIGDPLRPRIRLNVKTLADCKVAFANAVEAAGYITAEAVDALTSATRNDGPPRVCVMASWRGKGRKPNGFNAEKFEAWVEPAVQHVNA